MTQAQHWLLTRAACPVRFLIVALSAAVVQLSLLDVLVRHGSPALFANAVAYLSGAQIAFVCHLQFTWRDRSGMAWWRRWWRYMGTIAITGLLNQTLFVLAIHWLPVLPASALATSIVGVINYLAGNMVIFAHVKHISSQ